MNGFSCHVWKQEKQLSAAAATSRKEIKLHEKNRLRSPSSYAHTHIFCFRCLYTISISSAFSAPFWFSCSYISISLCRWALDWYHYRLWSPCNGNLSKITSSTHRGHFTFHVHSCGCCCCRCRCRFFTCSHLHARRYSNCFYHLKSIQPIQLTENRFVHHTIFSFFCIHSLACLFICFEYVHMFEIFVFVHQPKGGRKIIEKNSENSQRKKYAPTSTTIELDDCYEHHFYANGMPFNRLAISDTEN